MFNLLIKMSNKLHYKEKLKNSTMDKCIIKDHNIELKQQLVMRKLYIFKKLKTFSHISMLFKKNKMN